MTPAEKTTLSTQTVIAIGYVRASTAEQAESGLGLAAQRATIEAECERRSWTLDRIEEEAGVSGKSLRGRHGLHSALEDLRQGHASTLIVSKLDRLSRSLQDFAGLMEQARRERWNLVALDLGIDLSTPSGGIHGGSDGLRRPVGATNHRSAHS